MVFLSSSLNNLLVSGILKGINLSLKAHDNDEEAKKDEVFTKDFEELEIIKPFVFLEAETSAYLQTDRNFSFLQSFVEKSPIDSR